jgi:hypothetical protein
VRDACAAVAHVKVYLIQTAGLHSNQDLSCLSNGGGTLSYMDYLVAAVAVNVNGLHVGTSTADV